MSVNGIKTYACKAKSNIRPIRKKIKPQQTAQFTSDVLTNNRFASIGNKIKNAAKTIGNLSADMFSKVHIKLDKTKNAITSKTPQLLKTASKRIGMGLAGLTVAAGVVLAGKEAYDHIWGEESNK